MTASDELTQPDDEFDLDSDQARLERKLLATIAAGIVVAVAGVALVIWVFFLWDRASEAQDDANTANEGLNAVSSGLDALRMQVEELGQEPIVPPAAEIVEDVETGGDPVLVPGPEGKRGEPGPGPTPQAVQAAVDAHCAQQPGGSCEGPPGASGPEGATGPIGATGAAGAGVIGTSIIDCHLIVVFSDGSSTDAGDICGPPGPQGEQGEQGEQGPPGATCPEGYTLVEVKIPSSPEFVFVICSRSA